MGFEPTCTCKHVLMGSSKSCQEANLGPKSTRSTRDWYLPPEDAPWVLFVPVLLNGCVYQFRHPRIR